MMMNIEGLDIYISGASKGIGRALAIEFARQGGNLFLASRDTDKLSELCAEIRSEFGSKISYSFCDVTDRNSVSESIGQAEAFLESIDIAVLNAGISGSEKFIGFNSENLKKVFEVNVFGIARGIEFLLPVLQKKGKGIIAGISSLADSKGYPGAAAYASSKSALSVMLESARIELKAYNIDVITVRPGFVKTDMTDANDFHMPLLLQADKAAKIIIEGIKRRKRIIGFPLSLVWLTALTRLIPGWIFEPVLGYWNMNSRSKK